TDGIPLPLRLLLGHMQRKLRNPATLSGQAYLAYDGRCIVDDPASFFATEAVLAAEIPAGNGTTTARSLARVYACLSMNGELDGVRVLRPETVQLFARPANSAPDALLADFGLPGLRWLLARPITRSLGYLLNPAFPGQ